MKDKEIVKNIINFIYESGAIDGFIKAKTDYDNTLAIKRKNNLNDNRYLDISKKYNLDIRFI